MEAKPANVLARGTRTCLCFVCSYVYIHIYTYIYMHIYTRMDAPPITSPVSSLEKPLWDNFGMGSSPAMAGHIVFSGLGTEV